MPAFIRILLEWVYLYAHNSLWQYTSYVPIDTEQLLMPVYIRILSVFYMNMSILCPHTHRLVAYASIHQDFVGFPYEWFYLYPYRSSQQHRSYVPIDTEKLLMPAFIRILLFSHMNGSIYIHIVPYRNISRVVAYVSIHQDFVSFSQDVSVYIPYNDIVLCQHTSGFCCMPTCRAIFINIETILQLLRLFLLAEGCYL